MTVFVTKTHLINISPLCCPCPPRPRWNLARDIDSQYERCCWQAALGTSVSFNYPITSHGWLLEKTTTTNDARSVKSVDESWATRSHRQEQVGAHLFAHSGQDASGSSRSRRLRRPLWKKDGVSSVWWRQFFRGWARASRAHSDLTLLMLNKSPQASLQSS